MNQNREQNHENELKESGDLFYTWQYHIRWAAANLRTQGKLRNKELTPRGFWELSKQPKLAKSK